jgi:hypothetical protein
MKNLFIFIIFLFITASVIIIYAEEKEKNQGYIIALIVVDTLARIWIMVLGPVGSVARYDGQWRLWSGLRNDRGNI